MHLLRKFTTVVRRSCIVLPLFLCVTITHAESDLEKILRQQNSETVTGYVQPIADLFGANMHSGFNHTARIPQSGFNFKFEIIGMAGLVSDDQQTYRAKAPAGFGVTDFQTATVFGGKGTLITSQVDTSLKYRGSDGVLSTTIFPFATPQITIGHLYGTEVQLRYVPIPEISSAKLPKITLFGIGVRHSISQYIEGSPLDLAFGFLYNSFTIGDLITVKGYGLALQASKEFSVLVLYGGVQYEKSTLTISFTSTDPTATS
ncbi:MAG: DUF6588 family protein, partial [Bacteroidota bacterium]